ncbi:MAG: glucosamine-6-phosphate deaminase [Anaerolineae bacterium]
MTEGALPQAPLTSSRVDGVSVEIYADKEALGAAAAAQVADTLRETLAARGSAQVIFATGASQYEFLAHLITQEGIDWTAVTAFHLDEYLGLSDQHPASFRRYLRERLFSRLPFRAVHVLEGDAADPQAEVRRYAALLAERQIDIACIGIGENGHLAFNDPPADFQAPELVHIVTLDEACRRQQVGEGHFATLDEVPRQALSLSIPAILSANLISCVVPDARKAQAVRGTLEGPIAPACPGSALRTHKRVKMYLDTASASLLSRA